MMIDNYLTSLKKGLEKNQQEYLKIQYEEVEGLKDNEEAKKKLLEQ